MLRYLLAVSVLAYIVSGAGTPACPNYNSQTWISLAGKDCYSSYDYTANLTNKDYCWDNYNFNLQTHVTLANPSVPRQSDSAGDVAFGKKICAMNETHISYCQSHCMDKTIENALVQASMQTSENSQSIYYAAQDAMKSLGKSDWPLLMIVPFDQNSVINYQYYDDMNICIIDILFLKPIGTYTWPYRSFFITHKTVAN